MIYCIILAIFQSAVQRLEPVSNTCVAALPELLILGEKVLAQAFNNDENKLHTVSLAKSDS